MEKERSMAKKKAALFMEIMGEIIDRCYGCPFSDGFNCHDRACSVNDDAMTAIMSLDDPANWPHVFEK